MQRSLAVTAAIALSTLLGLSSTVWAATSRVDATASPAASLNPASESDELLSLTNASAPSQQAQQRYKAKLRGVAAQARKWLDTKEPFHNFVAHVAYAPLGLSWSGALGFVNGVDGVRAQPDNPFRIASVTKTFTAVAVLKLIEQERFGLDDPIEPLLSVLSADTLRIAGADPSAITVRQLLSHRSGLFDYVTREYFDAVISNPERRWSRQEQLEFGLALNPPIPADLVFLYSDTNYILLGEMLEHSTGKSFAAALRETIGYKRLGLRNTYLETLEDVPAGTKGRLHQFVEGIDSFDADPSLDLWGGGGLVSTVSDLSRFYRALFKGKIISPATLDAMTSEHAGGGFAESAYALGLEPFYIGNSACFGHTGFSGVMAAHCPDIDYTFAVSVGNNRFPGISFDPSGIGYALAKALGIDTTVKPFGAAFRLTRCPREVNSPAASLTCGMIAMQESRGDAASNTIELATILAKHPSATASRDPSLFLGGGPGVPLFPDLLALFDNPDLLEPLVNGQDVVFVEQRGVGSSVPTLNCDQVFFAAADAQPCIDKFQQQGVNLARYNSIDSAADMDDLRRTLGYSRWNLIGFSYGSRLALTMTRERPGTVRSLTLDGAFPPEADDHDDPPLLSAVIDTVFERCAADSTCDSAFPNLKARFIERLNALNAVPLMVNGNSINGDFFVLSLANFQQSPEAVEYLPAVMDAMARLDETFLNLIAPPFDPAVPIPDFDSLAMYFSVQCNEENPFIRRDILQAIAEGADPIAAAFARASLGNAEVCDIWPSGQAPFRESQPVDVHVPTLVFNGAYDLQTPPQTGRELASRIANAQAVEFAANGHVASNQSPECALSLVSQLQQTDDARAVDASCAAAMAAPTWKTSLDDEFYGGAERSKQHPQRQPKPPVGVLRLR